MIGRFCCRATSIITYIRCIEFARNIWWAGILEELLMLMLYANALWTMCALVMVTYVYSSFMTDLTSPAGCSCDSFHSLCLSSQLVDSLSGASGAAGCAPSSGGARQYSTLYILVVPLNTVSHQRVDSRDDLLHNHLGLLCKLWLFQNYF